MKAMYPLLSGITRSMNSVNVTGQKSLTIPVQSSFVQRADSFQKQVLFGANSGPLVPASDNVLSDEAILKSLPPVPFQNGFDHALNHASKGGKKATFEKFTIGTLMPLIAVAQKIDQIQANRSMLDSRGQELLDMFEQFLPDAAKGETLKAKELHRLLYTHLVDNWEKKDISGAANNDGDDEGGSGPRVIKIGGNSSQDELISAIFGGAPRRPAGALDPILSRFLTGFIRRHQSTLDRNLTGFIAYLMECKDKPGVPSEIQSVAVRVHALREAIVKGVTDGTLTMAQEQDSPQAFRKRLSKLFDETKPVGQRLMSERQYTSAKRLIETLERSGQNDPNGTTIVNRLHTILYDLPWTKTEAKSYTKSAVRDILDADHYGLDEVKSHIVDHMGKEIHLNKLRQAGKLKKGDERPTILCFVGPPGTGKTSLGKSIAHATGRNFVRIGLGGVSDEAAIRGHRSTYIGALPGRIAQGLIEAKSKNPVMLLDEIDKLGRDFKGDPAAALLEALDPEQNATFTDHYLGIETDLSDVLYITTANSLDTIPAPLLDRMQVIQLKGYTTDEKVEIAQRHLIPKARKANGLSKEVLELPEEPFKLDRETILEIIKGHAPDRGVRPLENNLTTLAKKVASDLADLDHAPALKDFKKINTATVREYLGSPKHLISQIDPTPQAGIANGMFYSDGPRSGGTLTVGVTLTEKPVNDPEKAGLVLGRITGNMKEVMKESAERAFSYVESNLDKLGIDLTNRRVKVDIHTGDQTPKDGPSAGGVLTLALISKLLDKPIPGDFAMTGAFNPLGDGKILKIGGVREKVTGAVEEGVTRVCIPADNACDIEDIPASVRAQVEIKPVSTMNDVLTYVFGTAPQPVQKAPKFAGRMTLVS